MVLVAFELLSPELAEWLINLDRYDRELLLVKLYQEREMKLPELGEDYYE